MVVFWIVGGMVLIALAGTLIGWGALGLEKLFLRGRNSSKA